MLAGADLVKARHRVASSDKSLPLKGPKEFQPNGSWLESKQVQSQLDERKALLDTHRVEKQQRLSTAEWHRDLGLGLVVRRVGDWESFGYESGCKLWIYPEEALYLLETNCIELLFDDVPMSIEQGYATLLAPNSSCSLEQYRTFSHLKCNGYHVRKHSPELTFTRYERQLRLDQYTVKSCFKAPKTIDPMERRTSLEVEIKEQDVIRVEEIPEMLMEEDEPPPKETDTEGKQVVAEMDPSMAEKETELPSSESINEDIVKDYESNSSSNNVVESEVSLNESDSKKELETSEPMDISLDTTPSTTAIDSSGVRVAEDSLTKDREKEEEPKSMTETREEPPSNQDDSRKQTELDSITEGTDVTRSSHEAVDLSSSSVSINTSSVELLSSTEGNETLHEVHDIGDSDEDEEEEDEEDEDSDGGSSVICLSGDEECTVMIPEELEIDEEEEEEEDEEEEEEEDSDCMEVSMEEEDSGGRKRRRESSPSEAGPAPKRRLIETVELSDDEVEIVEPTPPAPRPPRSPSTWNEALLADTERTRILDSIVNVVNKFSVKVCLPSDEFLPPGVRPIKCENHLVLSALNTVGLGGKPHRHYRPAYETVREKEGGIPERFCRDILAAGYPGHMVPAVWAQLDPADRARYLEASEGPVYPLDHPRFHPHDHRPPPPRPPPRPYFPRRTLCGVVPVRKPLPRPRTQGGGWFQANNWHSAPPPPRDDVYYTPPVKIKRESKQGIVVPAWHVNGVKQEDVKPLLAPIKLEVQKSMVRMEGLEQAREEPLVPRERLEEAARRLLLHTGSQRVHSSTQNNTTVYLSRDPGEIVFLMSQRGLNRLHNKLGLDTVRLSKKKKRTQRAHAKVYLELLLAELRADPNSPYGAGVCAIKREPGADTAPVSLMVPRVISFLNRAMASTPGVGNDTTHVVEETLRVVEVTPRAVEVTPRVVEETPRVIEATPQINEVTTHIVEETPRVVDETPRVVEVTPRVVEVTPQINEVTTHIVEETPRVVDETPRVVEVTPRVVEETPRVIEATPQINEVTTHIVEETPRVIEATPQINEVTTHIVEETPRVVDETPRVVEVTPRVVEATPQINEVTTHVVEETPRVVDKTPRVVEVTPRLVEDTPRVVEDTPPRVEETPRVVEVTPRVVLVTPQINEITTHVVEETPRVVEVTPRVVLVTPQINEVTAHAIEETLRLVEVTPRVNEDTTQVSEVMSRVSKDMTQVSEDTTEVSEDTSRVSEDTSQFSEDIGRVSKDSTEVSEDTTQVSNDITEVREDNMTQVSEDEVSKDMTQISEDMGLVSEDVAQVSKDITDVSEDTTRVSQDTTWVSNDMSLVSEDMTQVSKDITDVIEDTTRVSENTTRVSNDMPKVSEDMTQVSEDITEVSKDMTQISEDMSLVSEDMTQVSKDITDVSEDITAVSEATTQISKDMTHVEESRIPKRTEPAEGEVEPLLRPADCTTIGNILSRLAIIKPANLEALEVVSHERKLSITYDLYLPNTLFRKATPCLPNFRIIVLRGEEPIPEPGEIASLLQRYQDQVQLLYAVVQPCSVNFYLLSQVHLPPIPFDVAKLHS